ncbi:transmembrane amino acid transporter protein-domain-containing protein [Dactylonectria estremocensis]|uniref:Transmembrane amino acid transporter protein-domain-containing protein n=1 Tax=Dactylonectria estremocensis TaxID=1079267 RepID=A0A9P9FIK6_9HYPO|nr:transmembrane amino acid transporter protein-domain-containing protein [Dactylonectria estremocensis]
MIPTTTTPAAAAAADKITKDTSQGAGSHAPANLFVPDDSTSEKMVGEMTEFERRKIVAGNAKFNRLGWKRLTIVLIVQAIALGSLSIPAAFATLGMVAGVICSVGIGLIAIYTSYIVGQVKVTYPHVEHYPAAGGLMFGRAGYEIFGVMLTLQLVFLTASHCLTGTIAFQVLTESDVCGLVWGVVSAVILLLLAVPPSFAEVAILGYIDFVSIILAIGITIIATGVQKSSVSTAAEWSAWPKEDISFATAFIAICNIFFAYSFSISQFSFMDEMHTPTDYMKSIWTLGGIEIVIYTLTGALIYSFVGVDVKSPAILSTSSTVAKVAFGVALPVIYISGSINTTVGVRYIHGRIYKDSIARFVNTKKGWITWLILITVFTWISFVVAESIPFFSDLIAITSSLLNSGFTLYIPAMMWFFLLKKGNWYSKENLFWSITNGFIFVMGLIVLIGGTYSSIKNIRDEYKAGTVSSAFTCASLI